METLSLVIKTGSGEDFWLSADEWKNVWESMKIRGKEGRTSPLYIWIGLDVPLPFLLSLFYVITFSHI